MVYTLITSELEIWANGMFIIQAAIILRKGLYAWSTYTTQYMRSCAHRVSCYLAQLFQNGLWPCGQWPLAKVAQFF